MHTARESDKNEIEFRNYRKYGTESSITYGLDDPDTQPPPEASKPAPAPPRPR
jgi:hypothetical protein